ncbi:MAG: hypothetical protein GX488_04935 [Clostridiales bacterium]|nr:hypothetical protein [Clostridiales bacterium]
MGQALAQNYFAGQQKYVNQINEILDAVDEQIGIIKRTTDFGNPALLNGEANIPAPTDRIVPLPEIAPKMGTTQNKAIVPMVNIPESADSPQNAAQSVVQPETLPEVSDIPSETAIAANKAAIRSAVSSLGENRKARGISRRGA